MALQVQVADINAAPESVLRNWWKSLPPPKTDEERDIIERLAIRCEGCGMVDAKGKLNAMA